MRFGPHLGLSFSPPRLARLAHVGPIAFAGLKAFFLKLRPLRISQRDSEAGSAFTPLAAWSSPANSGMLISGRVIAQMSKHWALPSSADRACAGRSHRFI
jgi:hypothetical protein